VASQSTTATRTCRIIYYGSRGVGKRDNLLRIQHSVPQEHRLAVPPEMDGQMVSFRLRSGVKGEWEVQLSAIDTGAEDAGMPAGRTAPFDGIVFVAHSSASGLDQSLSALEAMKAWLDSHRLDVTSVPLVIQYNGREQDDCLPVDRLESLLNPWGLLSFPASANQGEGVRETLKAILSLTISKLMQDDQAAGPGELHHARPAGEHVREPSLEKRQDGLSGPVFAVDSEQPELQIISEDRRGLFYEDLRPPIVVPVRIPRRLIEKHGSARLILEIELDDGESVLG
jgi:hypothetical protein